MTKDFDVQFEGPLRPDDSGQGSHQTLIVQMHGNKNFRY